MTQRSVCAWVTILLLVTMTSGCNAASGEKRMKRANRPPTGPVKRWPIQHRLGCTHVQGTYSFTEENFLNEGADVILDAGFRVFKGYLLQPRERYRFNSDWPKKFDSLTEMVQHPYFQELFKKPFSTYIFTTYTQASKGSGRPFAEYNDELLAQVTDEIYELSKYFLTQYNGTGKTFVLQNWEGDWAVRRNTNLHPNFDAKPEEIAGMIRWLNARQDGVDKARDEVKDTDVKVYHACEVNRVDIALVGRVSLCNNVLPHTHCDLYSYSAYDTIEAAALDANNNGPFLEALNYIASKAPASKAFGEKNVMVGEFGWPGVPKENKPKHGPQQQMNVVRMVVDTAMKWGCPYIVYWQVYDNEAHVEDKRPTNDEVMGFYLIKPDGTPAQPWSYFRSLMPKTRSKQKDPGLDKLLKAKE